LGTTKRVLRCLKLPCDTVWLKALDPGCSKVYISPPPGHSWILLNGGYLDPAGLHGFREVIPGIGLGVVEALWSDINMAFTSPSVDEGLIADTIGIPTYGSLF